jgi:hypothetical protein
MARGPLLELDGDELVFNHKKTLVEEYYLRAKKGFAWARITISGDGAINIQSDYGSFSYQFGSMGKDYKTFIRDTMRNAGSSPTGYFYDKIKSTEREGRIEVKQTIANFKKKLIEIRIEAGVNPLTHGRYREATAEEARELWEVLDEKERQWDSEISQDQFYTEMSTLQELKEHVIGWEAVVHNYDDLIEFSNDRQAMAFCMYIAPAFADILTKELEEKSVVTTTTK